ncbi:calcium-binding protein [Variovorax sp. WS11]|uniref:calcium-binding protein n=1 Tax=Variovorax sp. WS11 TaxID=1105204 RepID=UPI0015E72FE8|nr:calcium-binding protein [Variovorax sp. WS11]
MNGGNGSDLLDGGAGNDALNGGIGNDTYVFGPGSGQDTLSDYDATPGNKDAVTFASGLPADQLWFRQAGNNLEVSIIGTNDKLTLNSWYAGSQYSVEEFRTSDGHVLIDTQVQNLVQAMASFAPRRPARRHWLRPTRTAWRRCSPPTGNSHQAASGGALPSPSREGASSFARALPSSPGAAHPAAAR